MQKKRGLLSIIIFCIILSGLFCLNYQPQMAVSAAVDVLSGDEGQIFWANQEDEFSPEYMELFDVQEGNNTIITQNWTGSSYLRFDFGVANKKVELSNLKIKTVLPRVDETISHLAYTNDVECVSVNENALEIVVVGADPYIVFDISAEVNNLARKIKCVMNWCNIIISFVVAVMVYRHYEHMKILIWWAIDILRNIGLIFELAISDFKSRYASSYLGMLWAFIQPVVTVIIYVIVFGYGFKTVPVKDFPFVLWLVAGIVPWFYFSDALVTATNSLREYSYLVKKVIFEIKILPLVKITAAFIVHVFFVLVAAVLYIANGYRPQIYYLQLIYYMFCTTVFVLGLAYLTSALNVFVPDLIQAINVFLQFGMWMTPIMWNADMFGSKIEKIIKVNPLYYIVEGYRDCFYNQIPFWEKPGLTIYFWTVTMICLILGMYSFKKLERHFADVL